MQDPGGPDRSRFLQPHFFLGRGVVSEKYRILRLGTCFELTVVECGCMPFEDESGICGVGSAAS